MKIKLFTLFLMMTTVPFFASEAPTQQTQNISSLESLLSIKIAILEGLVMGYSMKDLMIEEAQLNPKAYEFIVDISEDLYSSDIYQQILTDKLNTCFTQIEEMLNDTTKSLGDIDFYTHDHPCFPGAFMYSIIPLDKEIKEKTYELHKSIYTQRVTNYCNNDENWPFKNITFDKYLKNENTKIFEAIIFANIFNVKLLEKIEKKIQQELRLRHL